MLETSGVERRINVEMTENEARMLLLIMRRRQDEVRSVHGHTAQPLIKDMYTELNDRIELLKLKVAAQI